jgi:UDP-GlcNAc:undecaprenyl-phosphate GlcNAc-1-phosphate transferase
MTWRRLAVPNYRGVLVPRTLGPWLVAVAVIGGVAVAVGSGLRPGGAAVLAGSVVVFAAGLVDDLVPSGVRGLRGHARSLAAGRVTMGAVKAVVIAGSAVVVVASLPVRPWWARVAGVGLVAASANLWNGLDVRPGRALKAFAVAGVLTLGVDWGSVPPLPALVIVGVPPALVLDLRERAMLGDAGANLLGFVAGIALYVALPDAGVAAAAVVVVALNVLADTVTLTRAIEAIPPLRWLDRLGRAPEPAP